MKNIKYIIMKNIKYIISAFLFLSIAGCEDILDKQPLDIISDAIVWSDEALVDSYLADLYDRVDFIEKRGHSGGKSVEYVTDDQSIRGVSFGMIGSMGGESRSYGGHHQPYISATMVITGEGVNPKLDYWRYNNIRDCNFFMDKLQNESTLDPALINQRIAEVRFLRAYMYFQMVIRFGGIPILTQVQTIDTPHEELYVSRNTEKEVYDFIIAEMEAIAQVLPEYGSAADKGRPTKWAAYALKSRVALYAASIANYGEVQLSGLLGFPASDVATYAQISYDASKAIMDNSIHSLYEQYEDKVENYQNLFLDESGANTEVIMSEVYDYSKNRSHGFTMRAMPHDFSGTWAAYYYLYDFVERFEFADGRPGNSITRAQLESQEWTIDSIFHNRDPRFIASVFYPETSWQGGKVLFHSATIRGGETFTSGFAEDGWPYKAQERNTTKTGFMIRKRCNVNIIYPTGGISAVENDDTDYIIFRMGEIYLNLAEAAFYLNKTSEALTALNRLRERAGMPPKSEITEDIIHNERLVELTWENQSYWDIRRWRIAEELLDGVRMQGLKYIYNYDTKKYQIILSNGEGVARTFQKRNYYLPLGIDRIVENPNMVENPDY